MIRTITPIFSIIIALVIFFFFTQPKFDEIKTVQNETAQYSTAADKAKEINEELSRKVKEKREGYPPADLEKLAALVPDDIDEIRVLNDLNELARKHSMLFGNVTVTQPEPIPRDQEPEPTQMVRYDDLSTTDIDFSLIGTYDQFKSFLSDVEQSLVMLEVMKITFSTGEGDLQQYEMSARAFSLPPIE